MILLQGSINIWEIVCGICTNRDFFLAAYWKKAIHIIFLGLNVYFRSCQFIKNLKLKWLAAKFD